MDTLKMDDAADSVVNNSKVESKEETSNVKSVFDDKWNGTTSEVVTFLCGHHLSQYAKLFSDNDIDLDLFLTLTEDDLCGIGMTNTEDRKVLINGLSRLNKNKREDKKKFSLDLSDKEVGRMMSNTLSHLFMIHAALSHTRYRIKGTHNTSITLHMSSAHLLDILTNEALLQAKFLNNQLDALLAKKQAAVMKRTQQARKMRTLGCITVLMTVAVFAYCVHRRFK